MIKTELSYSIKEVYRDEECNILLLKITIAGCQATIGSVYGPDKKPYEQFYNNIVDKVKDFNNTQIVIGGDWNATLDMSPAKSNLDIDEKTNQIPSRKRSQRLRSLCANLKIDDPFRHLHPNTREVTYLQNSIVEKSRIDFFLVSYSLLERDGLRCLIKHDPDMRPFDHRAVKLYL